MDDRFAFVVPVYGCGYLDEADNQYGEAFRLMGPKAAEQVKSRWDPSSRLPQADMPMLWINSTEDAHFSLDVFTKSYRAVKGEAILSIQPGLKHSHAHGWAPGEIYAFADSVANSGTPLPVILSHTREERGVKVTFSSRTGPVTAELYGSCDVSDWFQAKWETAAATVSGSGKETEGTLTAVLPENWRAYFVRLTDRRRLTVSTDVVLV